ncbi:MAG: ABC transporter permease [Acholeplasmataceae bacterium]|nr:ABC transporter permease [Acholeplasmataceae bacterium]
MSKFSYLLRFQLLKRFKSKTFVITNIIVFLLLLLVANLNHIINAFDKGEADAYIMVVNQTGKESFMDDLGALEEEYYTEGMGRIHFEILTDYDENSTERNILIASFDDDILKAELKNSHLNFLKQNTLQSYLQMLKNNYLFEGLDKEEIELLEKLQTPLILIVETEDEATTAKEILSLFSMILSIPMFMLIVFSVQYIGGSIVEEKSSKAIEYLIANVSPKQHFFAKILTSFTFLVVQMLLMLVYGLVGGFLSAFVFGKASGGSLNQILASNFGLDVSDMKEILTYLPLALFFFLAFAGLGGLLFMVIMAFIAAISNSNEDFQQFQSPLMILMLVGFYGALFGTMAGPNIVVKILGYIPFFSPFMAPSLFLANIYSWYETLISLLVLSITTYTIYKLIMPAYKTAILSYDTDKFLKRIRKAFGKNNNNKTTNNK